MKSVTNDNLSKLRELSNEICDTFEYRIIVQKLKKIVESGKDEVESYKTPQSKMKCYESMCSEITKILNTIKL
jgi:hypothetical protein